MAILTIINKSAKQLVNARNKRLDSIYWNRKFRKKCNIWIVRLSPWLTKLSNNTRIFYVTLFHQIVNTVLKTGRMWKSYVIIFEKCIKDWEYFLMKVIELLTLIKFLCILILFVWIWYDFFIWIHLKYMNFIGFGNQ